MKRTVLVELEQSTGRSATASARGSQFHFRTDSQQKYKMKKTNSLLTCNLISIAIISVITLVSASTTCNEAICGSIVSKCNLLESCECDVSDTVNWTSCIKRCYSCLDYLQADCCSCFKNICRRSNDTGINNNNMARSKAIVGDIHEPIPALWDALMEGEDPGEGR